MGDVCPRHRPGKGQREVVVWGAESTMERGGRECVMSGGCLGSAGLAGSRSYILELKMSLTKLVVVLL